MKPIYYLVFLFLSITGTAIAQTKSSFGLRTGFTIIKQHAYSDIQVDYKPTMQAQIFGSRQLGKKLELELNATYNTPTTVTGLSTNIFDGPQYWFSKTTTTVIELGLIAKYSFIKNNKYAVYALGGLNATKTFISSNQYTSAYFGWSGPVAEQYSENKSSYNDIPNKVLLGFGINKNINNNWKISAQAFAPFSFEGVTGAASMNDYSPTYPVLQLGLAYCW